jgi:2-phospho-L-lactate guanylyltransferase
MIWAVIPAKCFRRAKSRLSLAPSARVRTARGFLERVLLAAAPVVDASLVITDCRDVAAHARDRGAHVLLRPPAGPLALTVDAGLQLLPGATRALVLMSDLPLLRRDDLVEMLRLLRTHEVVIAPDLVERGTNALGLRPANVMRTCFGRSDSFCAHLERARTNDLDVAVYRSPRTGLDIDSPGDLARV